jgi:hypothetical protein
MSTRDIKLLKNKCHNDSTFFEEKNEELLVLPLLNSQIASTFTFVGKLA